MHTFFYSLFLLFIFHYYIFEQRHVSNQHLAELYDQCCWDIYIVKSPSYWITDCKQVKYIALGHLLSDSTMPKGHYGTL